MIEKLSECQSIESRLVEKKIGGSAIAAPKVSVIIPAYNIAPYVEETLSSVFAQQYDFYEVIVLNDGSTDTLELETALEPFYDRITYAKQINGGASMARNAAICLARGDLIAFLDGDDVWFPNFLSSQVRHLEKNQLEMVYCDALLFGERLYEGKLYTEDAPSNGVVSTINLLTSECNVITSGTLMKKDLLAKFGLFDTDLPRTQDFELWFRLAKNGARIGYQKEVLLKYRVRQNNLSGNGVERAKRNIRGMEIIREKHQLTAEEAKTVDEQIKVFGAEFELEQGKLLLANGDFANARKHFLEANKFYRKPKLALLIFLLRRAPRLTRRLFEKMRPAEFSFIAAGTRN